jgi:hypothetical protein
MEIKPLLIDLIQYTFEQEMALIDHLTESEKSNLGGFERWSAKDVLAHNASWKEYRTASLQATSAEEQPLSDEQENVMNARTFEKYSRLSLDEVIAYAQSAHQGLLEVLQATSEEGLFNAILPWQEGRPVWRIFTSYGCTHPVIHLAEHYRQRSESYLATRLWEETAKRLIPLNGGDTWQGGVKYNLACQYAQDNQPEKAIGLLREALRLNPGLTEWSQHDPDFTTLRDLPSYQAIYAEQG